MFFMGAFVVGFAWFGWCFHFVKSPKEGRSQALSALVIIVVRCALLMSVSYGVLWCGVNFHNFCSLLCLCFCVCAARRFYCAHIGHDEDVPLTWLPFQLTAILECFCFCPLPSPLFLCSRIPVTVACFCPWLWLLSPALSLAFVSQRPFVSFRIITVFAFGHFVAELFSDLPGERQREGQKERKSG